MEKKFENSKSQNTFSTKDHNTSPAREQNWMENELDKLTEANSSKLASSREHVLTQWKKTKNLEKRLEELLPRITNSEKNIIDLMAGEVKNTA